MSARRKRLLSFVVATSMVFGSVPTSAFAEAIEESGPAVDVTVAGEAEVPDSGALEEIEVDDQELEPEEVLEESEASAAIEESDEEEEVLTSDAIAQEESSPEELSVQNEAGQYVYELDDEGNATITRYEGSENAITVPGMLDGHKVVAVGRAAFEQNGFLTSLTFSENVTRIDGYSFAKCAALETVTLPSGLEVLGCGAFQNCTALTSVNIPKSMETGEYCGNRAYPGPFDGCSKLRDVCFAEGITKLANGLFLNCGLEAITIPDTVTSIGWVTFAGCANLSAVEWGTGLREIGSSAFADCTSLTELTFPDNVKVLGCGAFQGCTSVTKVRLPKNVATGEHCGNRAYPGPFDGCTGLRDVEFARGYTELADGLFWNTGLRSIVLPESLTKIGFMTFADNTELKTVGWNQSLASIGSEAFGGCTVLEDVSLPDSMTFIDCRAFAD